MYVLFQFIPLAETENTDIPKSSSIYKSIVSGINPLGWFGKGKGGEKEDGPNKQASMGKENAMVYDKELKRWIMPGAPVEEIKAIAPPPMGGPAAPMNSLASSPSHSAQSSRSGSPSPGQINNGAQSGGSLGGSALGRRGTGKRNARSKYVDILNPNAKSASNVGSFLPPPEIAGAGAGNILMVWNYSILS